MQHLYRSGLALLGLFLLTTLSAQTYSTYLTGRMEVPPVATLASGNITAELNGNTLTVTGDFDDLESDFNTSVGAHLHIGYAGSNGPVAIPLVPVLDGDLRGGSFQAATNTFDLTVGQAVALEERRMYVNIHTVDNPNGAIRGQLRPASADVLTAGLYGPNQVPPVVTMAQGMLILELDGDQLTVSGSFNGLEGAFAAAIGGGAHLHTALPGANGPVDVPLVAQVAADSSSGVFAIADNTFTVTPNQVAGMLDRGYYANIHSTKYPAGEIRGQVVGDPRVLFRSALSGGFGVPMVQTLARGQVLHELTGDSLRVVGSFVGLTSPFAEEIAGGAHLHTAPAGRTGMIRVPLVADVAMDSLRGEFDVDQNYYPVDSAFADDLIRRRIYLNIHSDAHPAGETRGQLLPEAQTILTAIMNGSQEVDDVLTSGIGQIKAEVTTNRLTLSGGFQNLSSDVDVSIAGGLHVHIAPAGRNGPIVIPTPSILDGFLREGALNPFNNTYDISDGLQDSLLRRMAYFNVHTADHPMGEIRGQFVPDAANYVFAPLGGSNETDPVNTPATGMLIGELFPGRVTMTGSFMNLQSDYAFDVAGGAHLHNGLAGSNGDIVLLLNPTVAANNRDGIFEADSNVLLLSMDTLALIRRRQLYANIHSVDHPAGEIRGQVLPISRTVFHSTLQGMNSVPPNETTGIGSVKAEIRGRRLFVSGSFSDLTSDYDSSIGSHLHLGSTGETGNVIFPLTPQLDADLRGGDYLARDNRFLLDSTQMAAFRNKDMYVNIHTVDFPMGEIRGQVVSNPNLFPNADAEIITPVPGTTVTIEGDPTAELVVDWADATDPDNDTLAYSWQLALDEDFNTIVFMDYAGIQSELPNTVGAVDTLLANAGLAVGDNITLYHRAIITDGSNTTAGPSAEVTFERGMLTGLDPATQRAFQLAVYPTVVQAGEVTLEVSADRPTEATVYITTLSGQPVQQQVLTLLPGTQRTTLSTARLAAGTYYVNLLIDGRFVRGQRIVQP